MDEEISIIDTKTRNEKIKSFFIENKKILISVSVFLILILFIFYSYQIYKNVQRELLATKYNSAIIEFENGDKSKIISSMKEVIENKNATYSPLALYFLIDNNLINNKEEINKLFDTLIQKTKLDLNIKDLIIYKKALYNSDNLRENELINILNPVINSKSIWKSHALYILAEYFDSKNEKNKAKEFFQKIISLDNANTEIKIKAVKRIKRDFGE